MLIEWTIATYLCSIHSVWLLSTSPTTQLSVRKNSTETTTFSNLSARKMSKLKISAKFAKAEVLLSKNLRRRNRSFREAEVEVSVLEFQQKRNLRVARFGGNCDFRVADFFWERNLRFAYSLLRKFYSLTFFWLKVWRKLLFLCCSSSLLSS